MKIKFDGCFEIRYTGDAGYANRSILILSTPFGKVDVSGAGWDLNAFYQGDVGISSLELTIPSGVFSIGCNGAADGEVTTEYFEKVIRVSGPAIWMGKYAGLSAGMSGFGDHWIVEKASAEGIKGVYCVHETALFVFTRRFWQDKSVSLTEYLERKEAHSLENPCYLEEAAAVAKLKSQSSLTHEDWEQLEDFSQKILAYPSQLPALREKWEQDLAVQRAEMAAARRRKPEVLEEYDDTEYEDFTLQADIQSALCS